MIRKTIKFKNVTVGQAERLVFNAENAPIMSREIKKYRKQINAVRNSDAVLKIKVVKPRHVFRKIRNTKRVIKRAIKAPYHSAKALNRFLIHSTSAINGGSEGATSETAVEVARLNRAALNTVRGINRARSTVHRKVKKVKRRDFEKNRVNVKYKFKKVKYNKYGSQVSSGVTKAEDILKSTSKKNPSKNPYIKKKISKAAQRVINRVHKARKASNLVKATQFSFQAIKGFIMAIAGIASSFLGFIVIIGAVLMMITSPFSILLDDNPKSMRTQINEYFTEYRKEFNDIQYLKLNFGLHKAPAGYDTSNDRVRIVGAAPDVKEVLKLYIARNSDDSDDDVLIDTENFKIKKFESAFKDLNSIIGCDVINNTHEEERTDKNGNKEVVTVLDYREIIYYQKSETALAYAIRTGMSDEQIEYIKELSDPEYDKAWANLLYGINVFSYLDPGTMPYFNQGDYGNVPYGSVYGATVASHGCGPTSFAMVASYLTGRLITPVDIMNWSNIDSYCYNEGTAWSFFGAISPDFGIDCESESASFGEALDALRQGKVVISIQGPGIFTGGGHFIVLRGITPEGKILVSDPNGWNAQKWGMTIEQYKDKLWEPEQVSASGSNYWIFSSDLAKGGNPAEQVWVTLRARGYSEEVVAGIIGNMMAECGGQTLDLDWSIHGYYNGDTFYGLCQWCLLYTPSWFDGCSIQDQLNYLLGDIKSQFDNYGNNYMSGYNYSDFVRASSIDEAAAAFAACYERPGYEYNNYQIRRQNAAKAYSYFHGKRYTN